MDSGVLFHILYPTHCARVNTQNFDWWIFILVNLNPITNGNLMKPRGEFNVRMNPCWKVISPSQALLVAYMSSRFSLVASCYWKPQSVVYCCLSTILHSICKYPFLSRSKKSWIFRTFQGIKQCGSYMPSQHWPLLTSNVKRSIIRFSFFALEATKIFENVESENVMF